MDFHQERCNIAYAFRHQFSFSTYGENLFLTLQNTIIMLLIIYHAPTWALTRSSSSKSQKNYHCQPAHSCIGVWTVHYPNRPSLDSPNDHPPSLSLLQAPPDPSECPLAIHGSALRIRPYQPDCWVSSPAFHHCHRGRRPPCRSRLRPRPHSQHCPRCAIVHVLGLRRCQRWVWTS